VTSNRPAAQKSNSKEDSVTQKYLWSVVLIALLIAGVAVPARADNGMTVVIVIAATTAAVDRTG
jgi:hypothetical protein